MELSYAVSFVLSSHNTRFDLVKVIDKSVQLIKLAQPKRVYLTLSPFLLLFTLFRSRLSNLNIQLGPLQSSLLLLASHLCLRSPESRRQHGGHSKIRVFASHFPFLAFHLANPVAQRNLGRRKIGQNFRAHWTNHGCQWGGRVENHNGQFKDRYESLLLTAQYVLSQQKTKWPNTKNKFHTPELRFFQRVCNWEHHKGEEAICVVWTYVMWKSGLHGWWCDADESLCTTLHNHNILFTVAAIWCGLVWWWDKMVPWRCLLLRGGKLLLLLVLLAGAEVVVVMMAARKRLMEFRVERVFLYLCLFTHMKATHTCSHSR